MNNPTPWITVIGIGEDGLAGLSQKARDAVQAAEVLVGGLRHFTHIGEHKADRLTWDGGFSAACERIADFKGKRIVVLASGDPMYFGVGSTLARRFGADALHVVPVPGAVSLTAARLGWSLADVEVVTVHGRPVENLNLHLQPGRRIIALTKGGHSPAEVARLLTERGFGPSIIHVFEHLGGDNERTINGVAESWNHEPGADLNTLGIECNTAPDARAFSRLAGLADNAYEHDGQLTKREVRAMTLARLGPLAGETLWDVGAGAGSIAIEWMRAARGLRAVAFERDPVRAERITQNALNLGVPKLKVIQGSAPEVLAEGDAAPHAIFVGGSVSKAGVLEAAWDALKPGGRMVANAVTLESAARVEAFSDEVGGDITRITIEHRKDGTYAAKKPITQLYARKEKRKS